jgi:hypothetical protein
LRETLTAYWRGGVDLRQQLFSGEIFGGQGDLVFIFVLRISEIIGR